MVVLLVVEKFELRATCGITAARQGTTKAENNNSFMMMLVMYVCTIFKQCNVGYLSDGMFR